MFSSEVGSAAQLGKNADYEVAQHISQQWATQAKRFLPPQLENTGCLQFKPHAKGLIMPNINLELSTAWNGPNQAVSGSCSIASGFNGGGGVHTSTYNLLSDALK